MTEHVRQPNRMAARKLVPGGCSCGLSWPCPVATGEARWTALREYLTAEAASWRQEAAESLPFSPEQHEENARARTVDDALAKMTELAGEQ